MSILKLFVSFLKGEEIITCISLCNENMRIIVVFIFINDKLEMEKNEKVAGLKQ